MRALFGRFFALIGFLVTFVFLGGIFVYVYFFSDWGSDELPDKMILRFDLERIVEDSSNDNPFQYFGKGHPLALRTFLEAIGRAQEDERVKGLVIRAGEVDLALAHAEEMRTTLVAFKDSGKFISFVTDTFGESDDASVLYYLASVAMEIWLQPSGALNLLGFGAEVPFIKKLMSTFGVKAEFGQRHEFKTAPNMFLHDKMPQKQRESEVALLNAMQRHIDDTVASSGSLSPYLFNDLRSKRALNAREALDSKLITHLGYWSDFREKLQETYQDIPLIKFNRYVASLSPIEKTEKKIALIVVDGEIIRGQTPPLDFRGSSTIGGDTIAKAIRQAVKDEDVAAILLRIDSPGGSYIASDTMWDAVVRAREEGVPVVASLATVAASGGYFLAMAADKIISNATAVTGSIGAYAGKYVIEDLLKKYGVSWEQIKTGENANMLSMAKHFTPKQLEMMNHDLDLVYQDFITKFQDCRDIPADAVDGLARGRVFTGRDALKLRIVDQIGGYLVAVQETKRIANLPVDQPVTVEVFPRAKSVTERVREYIDEIDDATQFIKLTKDFVKDTQRAIKGTMSQVKYQPTLP